MPRSRSPTNRVLGPWFCAAIVLVVAFGFQGSRGLWEPDEGRYGNATIEMLDRGDWLVPRLHGLVYLDKPPVVYWSIATGVVAFGQNEWGARFGHGLFFALTALVVGAWATAASDHQAGPTVAALYATTLMPAVASNILTPDTPLVLAVACLCYTYWRYRATDSAGHRWLWALLMGLSVGAGMLTKGPAIFLFAAPVILHLCWEQRWRWLIRPELWAAALVALLVGASWYLIVATKLPGASGYFFDNMIAGRLWKTHYNRNSEWWKPLRVYGLTLLVGTLPWSLWALPRWPKRIGGRWFKELTSDPLRWFLVLSVLVPLALLSMASSRLELYILPLFPVIVMLIYRRGIPKFGARVAGHLLLTAAVLIALKGVGGLWVYPDDTRRLADAMVDAGVAKNDCVDVLQIKAHGLKFYGYDQLTWHTIWEEHYPHFETPQRLQPEFADLLANCDRNLWLLSSPQHRLGLRRHGIDESATCDTRPLTPRHDLTHCVSSL